MSRSPMNKSQVFFRAISEVDVDDPEDIEADYEGVEPDNKSSTQYAIAIKDADFGIDGFVPKGSLVPVLKVASQIHLDISKYKFNSPRSRGDAWLSVSMFNKNFKFKSLTTDEKNLLATALALGLMAPGAVSSMVGPASPVVQTRTVAASTNTLDLFPDEMRGILRQESNNGKYTKHRVVKYGINKGDRAVGYTGLMPITVRETIGKNKILSGKYSKILDMTNDEITDYLNIHTKIEAEIASSHWRRLDQLFGDDHNRKVYAWNQGITAAMRADDERISNHHYVAKVLSHEAPLLAYNK